LLKKGNRKFENIKTDDDCIVPVNAMNRPSRLDTDVPNLNNKIQ